MSKNDIEVNLRYFTRNNINIIPNIQLLILILLDKNFTYLYFKYHHPITVNVALQSAPHGQHL